jgi:hypothetical protein
MTKPHDLTPLDSAMLSLEVRWKTICRLANDFEVPDDRVYCLLVFDKGVVIEARDISFDLLNRLPDIFDQEVNRSTRHQSAPVQ